MPEYLAPGVYIEERSFRSKSIEGVSTSTAGFVGPTRFGPIEGQPELVTSFADFERTYGGLNRLVFGNAEVTNYVAHAVRSFFDEGGQRLYVSRVYLPDDGSVNDDHPGHATSPPLGPSPPGESIALRARYPGAMGEFTVTLNARVGQNILVDLTPDDSTPNPTVRGLVNYDVVLISDLTSPIDDPPGSGTLYLAELIDDEWRFTSATSASRTLDGLIPPDNPADSASIGDRIQIVTCDITVTYPPEVNGSETWAGLSFHPEHRNSLHRVFGDPPSTRARELTVPLVIDVPDDLDAATQATLLFGSSTPTSATSRTVTLEDGSDGKRPGAGEYLGKVDTGQTSPDESTNPTGLRALETIPDISIIAAPGSTFGYSNGYRSNTDQIVRHLISHCENMRYRIAVLDAPEQQTLGEIRAFRGQIDSTHAALYYPWVTIFDPLTRREIMLPPSGFVTGIYARNDGDNGVHKAPANEVVRQAIGFEKMLNKAQQDVLNPEGINCFRWFQGRGYRLWGARTISSDPEWKYVNLRRYFVYLERSIEIGTQWVVFENNGPALWANVTRTIESFLYNEFKSGRLLGETPETSYFVRCDLSTMTLNDLDNGRLICLIGVAPLRPAEFVIFRIGQWTADNMQ